MTSTIKTTRPSKKKKRKSEVGSVVSDVASAHEQAAIDDTLMQKHGFSALQALNDTMYYEKYLELIAQA